MTVAEGEEKTGKREEELNGKATKGDVEKDGLFAEKCTQEFSQVLYPVRETEEQAWSPQLVPRRSEQRNMEHAENSLFVLILWLRFVQIKHVSVNLCEHLQQ